MSLRAPLLFPALLLAACASPSGVAPPTTPPVRTDPPAPPAPSAPPAPHAPRRDQLRRGAWITSWDLDRGLARVETAGAPSRCAIDELFYFSASLDETGEPLLQNVEGWKKAKPRIAEAGGPRCWLTLVNDVVRPRGPASPKDPGIVHRILADPALRAGHLEAILRLAREEGFGGVDLDYENLDPQDREDFSDFVEELSADLASAEIPLSVTLEPKFRDWERGSGAFDLSRLGAAAERVQIMLYDQHWRGSEPGPLATPEWITRVLAPARRACPGAMIVPVLKLSGMDWGEGTAAAIQHGKALELARDRGAEIERDPQDQVPFFHYRKGDHTHTVYFEDAESIRKKVETLRDLGFEEITLWSLGQEDPAILPSLGLRLSESTP